MFPGPHRWWTAKPKASTSLWSSPWAITSKGDTSERLKVKGREQRGWHHRLVTSENYCGMEGTKQEGFQWLNQILNISTTCKSTIQTDSGCLFKSLQICLRERTGMNLNYYPPNLFFFNCWKVLLLLLKINATDIEKSGGLHMKKVKIRFFGGNWGVIMSTFYFPHYVSL